MPSSDPFRETDEEARALAQRLMGTARFGALGVIAADTGAPHVTRIAVSRRADAQPLTLISSLSRHTGALRADPRCSLLLGEPPKEGDPLAYPRISLACRAEITEHDDPAFAHLREQHLAAHPKARLYVDFTDFVFATLLVSGADLNGGFGKAYRLAPADMALSSG